MNVTRNQDEYEQIEVVLDEQILLIMKLLAVLSPVECTDRGDEGDTWAVHTLSEGVKNGILSDSVKK